MFLKFFQKIKSSVYIKPRKKKTLSTPKAPHRFKMSRHLLYFSRYEILVTFNYPRHQPQRSFRCLKNYLSQLLQLFRKIDSSICYQKHIKIQHTISSKDFLK